VEQLDLARSLSSSGARRRGCRRWRASAGPGRTSVHRSRAPRRDHLQGELVVVAQEDAPLRARRDRRGVCARISMIGVARLLRSGVVSIRGMRGSGSTCGTRRPPRCRSSRRRRRATGWPRRAGPGRGTLVDHRSQRARKAWVFGQVLAVGALLLEEVGHGVEAEAVDAQVHPEPHDVDHRVVHGRVLVVEVGLVGEEPVPVELRRTGSKVQLEVLGVDEDDARVRRTGRRCRTTRRSRRRVRRGRCGRGLEPRVLVGLVWFMTKSVMIRMPRAWASSTARGSPPRCRTRAAPREVGDVVAAVAQREA
jgi:hypothetical protein